MLDIHLIRQNRAAIEKKLQTKDPAIDLSKVCELDEQRRELQTKTQHLKALRNELSQQIAEYKRAGKDVGPLMQQVSGHGSEIHALDSQLSHVEKAFEQE